MIILRKLLSFICIAVGITISITSQASIILSADSSSYASSQYGTSSTSSLSNDSTYIANDDIIGTYAWASYSSYYGMASSNSRADFSDVENFLLAGETTATSARCGYDCYAYSSNYSRTSLTADMVIDGSYTYDLNLSIYGSPGSSWADINFLGYTFDSNGDYSLNGILTAGTYDFDILLSSSTDYTSGFELTMSLTPVPIPASIWLFGSALTVLIPIARRKVNGNRN